MERNLHYQHVVGFFPCMQVWQLVLLNLIRMSVWEREEKQSSMTFSMSGWIAIISSPMLGETNFSRGLSLLVLTPWKPPKSSISLSSPPSFSSFFVPLFVSFVAPCVPHTSLEMPSSSPAEGSTRKPITLYFVYVCVTVIEYNTDVCMPLCVHMQMNS